MNCDECGENVPDNLRLCPVCAIPKHSKASRSLAPARLLECVELAILANGGGAHKKEMCCCDASVGMTPCEYCAIWDALNKTWNYLLDLKGKHSNASS
jgi:hypothetical protein